MTESDRLGASEKERKPRVAWSRIMNARHGGLADLREALRCCMVMSAPNCVSGQATARLSKQEGPAKA